MKNYYKNVKCSVVILNLAIAIFVIACWVVNLVKFTECDFEDPYKSEIIHGVGVVFPPASVVTCWFPSEEQKIKEKYDK